jgi:hypothetical protein
MSYATSAAQSAIVGEPEVLEDGSVETSAAWLELKVAVSALRPLQVQDGSIPNSAHHADARALVTTIAGTLRAFVPVFPHDEEYLRAAAMDFEQWEERGFGVPDFFDSLAAFQPQLHRIDGLRHLVVFPMYTQNGSTDRLVEAVIVEVIWPEFVAALEAGEYSNALFVPIRFIDFTEGYDTNSAPGERSSPTGRPRDSAGSCVRHPPSRSSTCRRMRCGCSTTSTWPKRPSSCGTSSTTAPTCVETCPSIRS